MRAGVNVKSRADKDLIEKALADERVLNFVREIGTIKMMTNPGLQKHAMEYYDGVLAESAAGVDEPEEVSSPA